MNKFRQSTVNKREKKYCVRECVVTTWMIHKMIAFLVVNIYHNVSGHLMCAQGI